MNDHQQSAQGSRRFDAEAKQYDQRTGISADIAEQVANAIHHYAATVFDDDQSLSLLEVAAGTGELGHTLSQYFNYSALEGSMEMMDQFKQRVHCSNTELQQRLHLADANQTWPVNNQSQDIVFIARAAHLLEPSHLVNEIKRCTRDTGLLMLARVKKPQTSVANRLRRELHRLLKDKAYQAKQGQQAHQHLIKKLDPEATELTAATWTVFTSPQKVLQAWRSKPGLAGVTLKETEQTEILNELEKLALKEFGQLDIRIEEQRTYQMSCARIHLK